MLIRSCPIQNTRSYAFAGKYSADTQEPTRHRVAQLSCNIWGFLYQHLLFYIRCLPLSAQLLLSLFCLSLLTYLSCYILQEKLKCFTFVLGICTDQAATARTITAEQRKSVANIDLWNLLHFSQ